MAVHTDFLKTQMANPKTMLAITVMSALGIFLTLDCFCRAHDSPSAPLTSVIIFSAASFAAFAVR